MGGGAGGTSAGLWSHPVPLPSHAHREQAGSYTQPDEDAAGDAQQDPRSGGGVRWD